MIDNKSMDIINRVLLRFKEKPESTTLFIIETYEVFHKDILQYIVPLIKDLKLEFVINLSQHTISLLGHKGQIIFSIAQREKVTGLRVNYISTMYALNSSRLPHLIRRNLQKS